MSAPKKRVGLGRGLSALLEDNDRLEHERNGEKSTSTLPSDFFEVSMTEIETNPFQPRTHFDQIALQELAESIRVHGIIQPITVRRLNEHQYQLISGERRFQASKLAGLTVIPAYVRTANDQQMLEMALIENIQRENLNAIEVSLSYQRLITEIGLKQEELGERVGKNRTTVNNYLRLLRLPPDIQLAIKENKISMGHARALITIENIEHQLSVFNRILKEDLSVRKVEEIVRSINQPGNNSTTTVKNKSVNPAIASLQNKMMSHFGTRVIINSDDKIRGEIKIPFVSAEDLNRILEILRLDE